jgi:hypothetical protein
MGRRKNDTKNYGCGRNTNKLIKKPFKYDFCLKVKIYFI